MKKVLVAFLIGSAALIAASCSPIAWLQSGDTLNTVISIAQPYLVDGCKEITVAPTYTLVVNADQSTEGNSSSFNHYGGFLIGGCGKLAELRCDITKKPEEGPCQALRGWMLQNNPDSTPVAWK